MGSNKRYPDLAVNLAEERELRHAQTRGTLHTLTAEQLQLHTKPVTIVPDRTKLTALAWLQFGDTHVRCTVTVKRWTDTAVGVQITIDGTTHKCWIWQGACQQPNP